MDIFLGETVLKALHFASIAHRDQLRRGPNKIPYISHTAAVGHILWKASYSEDVTAAGILHDVIEDTKFGYEDIEKEFGKHIADWVQDVSEDGALPLPQRKQAYLDHLETAPLEAKAISAADLMSNRYTMVLEMKQGFKMWRNWEIAIKFDLRRLEILKQGPAIPFMEELEQVMQQVHSHYKK